MEISVVKQEKKCHERKKKIKTKRRTRDVGDGTVIPVTARHGIAQDTHTQRTLGVPMEILRTGRKERLPEFATSKRLTK